VAIQQHEGPLLTMFPVENRLLPQVGGRQALQGLAGCWCRR
jgi:hypothetical protein